MRSMIGGGENLEIKRFYDYNLDVRSINANSLMSAVIPIDSKIYKE